jgi:hypothetical protein
MEGNFLLITGIDDAGAGSSSFLHWFTECMSEATRFGHGFKTKLMTSQHINLPIAQTQLQSDSVT